MALGASYVGQSGLLNCPCSIQIEVFRFILKIKSPRGILTNNKRFFVATRHEPPHKCGEAEEAKGKERNHFPDPGASPRKSKCPTPAGVPRVRHSDQIPPEFPMEDVEPVPREEEPPHAMDEPQENAQAEPEAQEQPSKETENIPEEQEPVKEEEKDTATEETPEAEETEETEVEEATEELPEETEKIETEEAEKDDETEKEEVPTASSTSEEVDAVTEKAETDLTTSSTSAETGAEAETADPLETEKQEEELQLKEEETQKTEQQNGDLAEAPQEDAKADPALGEDVKMPLSVDTETQQHANRQMQFPFASSNFLAPSPTPIRPLDGDPRAMKQQQEGDSANDADTSTNASGNTQNDAAGANNSNAVSQSQMFYHQTNAPSFYTTPQDGPPVGPAMMEQSQPSSAPMASQNTQNNPNWNPQMGQQGAPTTRSPSNQQGGGDPGLTPAPFPAKSLVPLRLDENSYGLDRAKLSRLGAYAKNASTPAQASALAVDVLRASIGAENTRAHGWKNQFPGDEYEVLLQKGSIGLCMNMSVRLGSVSVTSFRRPEPGLMGPAEASGVITVGDDLIAVDGFLVQSQEDFARVVSRLKSLRPVLLRFRRPGGNGLVSSINRDAHGYRKGQQTSIAGLDNPQLFTAGMWHLGVRYISPNRWAAELHVDGGGIRRLGFFSTEKEAARAYNQYIIQTYGNGAVQFMNPAGSGAHGNIPAAMSNMQPVQRRRPLLRAAFTAEQKEQLRAQIMVFKFTSTGGNIPNEILSRALKTTAHNYIQPNANRNKRKNFAPIVMPKPAKKKTKRGKKKKAYSDEDEDESDSDDEYSGPKVLSEEKPARRSGRNLGKAKKKYVDEKLDFEISDEEKPDKPKQKEAAKGPQIDKIVSVRFHKDTAKDTDVSMEFLIKWKDTSYLHVSWLSVREIEEFGQHAIQRMKRHLQKNSRLVEDARETVVVGEEKDLSNYFSDSYIEVDRILNAKEVEEPEESNPYLVHLLEKDASDTEDEPKVPKKKGIKYLVKWRDMSYVDCTWEWEDQLTDDRKIAAFHRFNHPPIINGAHPASYSDVRPEPNTWAKYLESPVYNNQNTLRSYQLEGLNWLTFCWYNRRNCILADEMGLGKTVQATSILEHLRQREFIRGPFLVVAPLATLGNWKREIETWTAMNCVVYHDSEGGSDIRAFIREQEFHFASEAHRRRGIYKFNVLVTSYQTLMMDAEFLDSIHWRYIVIDEAHKLKNREAKLLQVLHGFTWDSCLLMTGTPLQNGVFELWCLLNFIEPEKFPSQQEFYDEFGDLNTAEQVAQLHEQLRPYMLRRVKEDVEKSIPPKEETIVDVELTTMQKKYYRAIFERNRQFLNMGATGTVANLVNVEMELRKCCNHPFLIRGVEDKECAGFDEQLRMKILIQASGKTVLLDKLLTKFRQEQKKVLIFSQFKIMLDIIEDMCQLRGYSMERLDGSVRGNSRQAAIDRFNNPESDTFAFLLSTRAGGVGINLIAASVVILFDSDWNPQNDLQAVARCHRIGQTQSVNIYRLVTKKTYEAQMFEIASKKLGMHHAVFETGGVRNEFDGEDDSSGNMMSLMSLDRDKVEMMIRYGAYAIMGEEDEQDPENRAINELDIDHLLSTSRTIRYDPTKSGENAEGDEDNSADGDSDAKPATASQASALSFSKATFTSESADTTIDFNDEKFWEKVLGPKPVQVLMTKVQEGWLKTASQDDVKEFLLQLRELARAVVKERQRGKSLADADQVLAILIELKVTGCVIKGVVNVREVATEWLQVIERPRRRRSQDVGDQLMYLEFLDGPKDKPPKTKKGGARRKRTPKANGRSKEQKSDDEDLAEDEIDLPKRKKAARQASGGRSSRASSPSGRGLSGIHITLKRSKSTEDFGVVKVSSKINKVQKKLDKSPDDAESPSTPVKNKQPVQRQKTEEDDGEEHLSGSEDEEEEEHEDEEHLSGSEDEDEDEDAYEDEEEPEKPRGRPRKKARTSGKSRKAAKVSVDPQEDEEMWCRVCFSDQGFLDDPIVQCEKCSVAVHQYCYGIESVPEGDDPWFCDFCTESNGSSSDATCELCPLKRQKSAFKKTVEDKWVHVVCALWAPGVQFSDVERMSGVKHVVAAAEELKDSTCALCEQEGGCIKCMRGGCETYFHPLCGRETKGAYDMFMKEGGQLQAFCQKHRTHRKRS
ncbi:Chromodomain-helicase-DNA-binding protein 7 [Phytophthora cactorum]|uniref:Chromodomain-helicase-DNA-binding protein 7 n=1 Tax=Phytophthora cactorum TaxID=29920 RepID=A0A329T5H5_9STRA|nr:P-loop containing nucleoside triphosphate hydrolase [Phytophthora cactorum]KAG2778987.1 Chromodomain-helicase-DNA-binding protein 7 [Phytophthora cactorum]KAG2847788.1 Chromodomain-helicase-DNA-binding protein 7 [Phytophthora cactorum]KAG2849833.1 Chromodomain-helicase-DNA-binding protein 7 [Phytophthora cactorum]KAG2869267.1 Chromodomain-helicase-DNA-binding protein 7 [Phytophthora cactorum]